MSIVIDIATFVGQLAVIAAWMLGYLILAAVIWVYFSENERYYTLLIVILLIPNLSITTIVFIATLKLINLKYAIIFSIILIAHQIIVEIQNTYKDYWIIGIQLKRRERLEKLIAKRKRQKVRRESQKRTRQKLKHKKIKIQDEDPDFTVF